MRSHTRWLTVSLLLGAALQAFAQPRIPVLDWAERSDWTNVCTDVTPAAVGDGVADDTAALQAALDGASDGSIIYLPAGTYRISETLTLTGPMIGALVVGHGAATRIVWDGPEGRAMFVSNGVAYSRYVGLTWDGQGRAAVAFDHASKVRFETEVRHEDEAFLNCTGFGVRVGHEQVLATAEVLYRNCLFERCGTGLGLLAFNDYNHTLDGCEFRACGTGVFDTHGNFYARNTHFERSSDTDFFIKSEHGSTIRRCTSYGSQRFVTEGGTIAPVTLQDCHIAAWGDPDGAVHVNGAPVLIMDCVFTEPPSDAPPVTVAALNQRLILSANTAEGATTLVRENAGTSIVEIPPGAERGVIASPTQTFLHDSRTVPSVLFDAKADFGAAGDGVTDDTAAIQAAIDAARAAGGDAIAYLPSGVYIVSETLQVTEGPYALGGTGFMTNLVWRGAPGGVLVRVTDPQGITLSDFRLGHHDSGPMDLAADIEQVSTGGPSRITYDGVYAFGMYQKQPNRQGIVFRELSPESLVHGVHIQGNLRFEDSARARVLMGNTYEGTVTVSGASPERDGLLGFMTRLATIAAPTLHIRDNHSIVMSDFYNEQSDSHLLLEGSPDMPEGAVTIQGAKMQMLTQEPSVDMRGYRGRVVLGPNQFYCEPVEPRIIADDASAGELVLLGHFVYNCTPMFDLSPTVHLTLMQNLGLENAGLERAESLTAASDALDDLRRLGRLDHEVNEWLRP